MLSCACVCVRSLSDWVSMTDASIQIFIYNVMVPIAMGDPQVLTPYNNAIKMHTAAAFSS